jgi:hypothetical protein
MPSGVACPYCHGGGKCAECNGTGINIHVNEDEPKCRNCRGLGTCPNCKGSGMASVDGPAILDIGLDRL